MQLLRCHIVMETGIMQYSNLVFKLTVTDDKDDTGEDDVTVEVEQIPQNDSDSEGGSN